MNLEQILKAIEIANKLLTILGDVKLSEAKNWLDVEKNAAELRGEGHETDVPAE